MINQTIRDTSRTYYKMDLGMLQLYGSLEDRNFFRFRTVSPTYENEKTIQISQKINFCVRIFDLKQIN